MSLTAADILLAPSVVITGYILSLLTSKVVPRRCNHLLLMFSAVCASWYKGIAPKEYVCSLKEEVTTCIVKLMNVEALLPPEVQISLVSEGAMFFAKLIFTTRLRNSILSAASLLPCNR